MKFLVLVNLKGSLGGAEIRYLSLFNEISKRKNDYSLIINRRLYEIAVNANRLDKNSENIIVLEIDKPILQKPQFNIVSDKRKINIKKYAVGVKFLYIINQSINFLRLLKYSIALYKVFKKKPPSYVYAVWIGGMISWPLKYLFAFKFVYSFMDSGFSSVFSGFKNPLKNERMALRNADIIDFLSADLYLGLKQLITLSHRTKIAVTPCSFKNYDKLVPKYPKINTITFCSRMTPIKNPLLFLESISIFNKKYKNWKNIMFQFLGDGECMEQMKKYVKTNKLINVQLLGNVENPENYFQLSKIFISIQQSNNYPSQSLLEAMACGNAIIASDVGETRLLVTEKEGVLVKLEAAEIANALIYLLENNEKCTMLGFNAREKVLKEHTIENYLKYFYSLENL